MSDLRCHFHAECIAPKENKYGRVSIQVFTYDTLGKDLAANVVIELSSLFNLQDMHRQADHYIIFSCYQFILPFVMSDDVQISLLFRGSQALLFQNMNIFSMFVIYSSSGVKISESIQLQQYNGTSSTEGM